MQSIGIGIGSIFEKICCIFEKNLKINFRRAKPEKEKELFESFQLMCLNKGYGLEEYTVTTEDNYKLQLFRIINKKLDISSPKQAVYFQHGLLDSSDAWICNYEKNCLPFILCKKGFDIFVGNSRGNKYSKYVEREEGGRDPSKEAAYWDYSFHEMGIYDIPAYLDKILSVNKHTQKVVYFGHSQGGSSILAGMCEKLEYYKQKLRTVILLAPASRVDSYDSSFLTFIKDLKLEEKFQSENTFEIFPYDPDLNDISVKVGNLYPTMHYAMLELTSDEVSWMNCPERIKFYMAHYPSGTSLKSLIHFKQLISARTFQCYDYGEEENLKRYGTIIPKQYDLTQIEGIPIVLCGGLNDKLTHINDIRWLKSQLEGRSLFSYYEFDHMGHVSFLINNDIVWFNFILRDLYKILDNAKIISHVGSVNVVNNCNNINENEPEVHGQFGDHHNILANSINHSEQKTVTTTNNNNTKIYSRTITNEINQTNNIIINQGEETISDNINEKFQSEGIVENILHVTNSQCKQVISQKQKGVNIKNEEEFEKLEGYENNKNSSNQILIKNLETTTLIKDCVNISQRFNIGSQVIINANMEQTSVSKFEIFEKKQNLVLIENSETATKINDITKTYQRTEMTSHGNITESENTDHLEIIQPKDDLNDESHQLNDNTKEKHIIKSTNQNNNIEENQNNKSNEDLNDENTIINDNTNAIQRTNIKQENKKEELKMENNDLIEIINSNNIQINNQEYILTSDNLNTDKRTLIKSLENTNEDKETEIKANNFESIQSNAFSQNNSENFSEDYTKANKRSVIINNNKFVEETRSENVDTYKIENKSNDVLNSENTLNDNINVVIIKNIYNNIDESNISEKYENIRTAKDNLYYENIVTNEYQKANERTNVNIEDNFKDENMSENTNLNKINESNNDSDVTKNYEDTFINNNDITKENKGTNLAMKENVEEEKDSDTERIKNIDHKLNDEIPNEVIYNQDIYNNEISRFENLDNAKNEIDFKVADKIENTESNSVQISNSEHSQIIENTKVIQITNIKNHNNEEIESKHEIFEESNNIPNNNSDIASINSEVQESQERIEIDNNVNSKEVIESLNNNNDSGNIKHSLNTDNSNTNILKTSDIHLLENVESNPTLIDAENSSKSPNRKVLYRYKTIYVQKSVPINNNVENKPTNTNETNVPDNSPTHKTNNPSISSEKIYSSNNTNNRITIDYHGKLNDNSEISSINSEAQESQERIEIDNHVKNQEGEESINKNDNSGNNKQSSEKESNNSDIHLLENAESSPAIIDNTENPSKLPNRKILYKYKTIYVKKTAPINNNVENNSTFQDGTNVPDNSPNHITDNPSTSFEKKYYSNNTHNRTPTYDNPEIASINSEAKASQERIEIDNQVNSKEIKKYINNKNNNDDSGNIKHSLNTDNSNTNILKTSDIHLLENVESNPTLIDAENSSKSPNRKVLYKYKTIYVQKSVSINNNVENKPSNTNEINVSDNSPTHKTNNVKFKSESKMERETHYLDSMRKTEKLNDAKTEGAYNKTKSNNDLEYVDINEALKPKSTRVYENGSFEGSLHKSSVVSSQSKSIKNREVLHFKYENVDEFDRKKDNNIEDELKFDLKFNKNF